MPFSKEHRPHTLNGILFVALFSIAAIQLSQIGFIKTLKLSPLIIGIIIGMFYANTLRNHLPAAWTPGIVFSAKVLLRVAIIFYGFRLTFQSIIDVGVSGFLVALIMLTGTFLIGTFVGIKILRLDRDTAILTSAGSSICGAAAVLATEPVLNAKPYKTAVAVGTVVLFGTTSMFLYPLIYRTGILHMLPSTYGIYVGGTIHEVAQVVAAGSAVAGAANNAVIVKMTRVMLLAPFLLILGMFIPQQNTKDAVKNKKLNIAIPWFAVWFIVVIGFNSLQIVPQIGVQWINTFDTFLLTMAMTALGMETHADKFKIAGIKPLLLALILFIWLIVGGFFITGLIVG